MSDDLDDGFGPVLRGDARPDRPQPDRPSPDRPQDDADDWLPASSSEDRQDVDGAGPVMRGRRGLIPHPGRSLRSAPEGRGRSVALPSRSTVRALVRVLGGLSLVVLLFVGALSGLAAVRVKRVEVTGLAGGPAGTTNVLLVGSDSRDGLSDEQLLALGTEAVEGRRTDSILLLSVRGGRAAAMSFPRDLVTRRCDGTTGRINGAYASGGPSCLVQTIQDLSGIGISHYAEVNFAGFLEIVDAVGGVQVQLDEPLVDRFAGVDLPAGCQTLDGRQSLGFVRSRKVDSDLGRIARQQRFVAELVRSIVRPATLANPVRLTRITTAGADALTVDRTFGPITTFRLARAAPGIAGGGLATVTVPASSSTLGGADVLVPTDAAAGVFAGFADGSVLDPLPPAAPPAEGAVSADAPAPQLPGATDEGAVGAGAPTCGS